MKWYRFTIGVEFQLYYDKLIEEVIATYGHLKSTENSFTFYKKIEDRNAEIYLSVDDAVIGRKFINIFPEYTPLLDGRPKDLDLVNDVYQPVL